MRAVLGKTALFLFFLEKPIDKLILLLYNVIKRLYVSLDIF